MSDGTTLDMTGLEKLIKALKQKARVRVGILGDSAPREGSGGASNADIGAAHEFGTSTLPQRSFLRMPITMLLDKRLKDSNILSVDNLRKVLKTGSMVDILKQVGIVAEGIVADAFDTGGFGKWVPSDMTRKTNHQTLVETTQLRNSITSEVKEG
jgi:phage gpG-like protein